jgi:hypothetical protein
MRTFYRDLNFLAASDIQVRTWHGHYELLSPLPEALRRLPFPPPELSFADVIELTKGRGPARQKLRAQLERLTPHAVLNN